MHTKRIGTQGELLVCQDLIARGYDIFTHIGDYSVIDVVALKDGKFLRLQVKTNLNTSKGVIRVSSQHGQNQKTVTYKEDSFDYVAHCALDKKIVVYVPLARLLPPNGHSIVLRFAAPKSFNGKVHYVSDFQTLAPVV